MDSLIKVPSITSLVKNSEYRPFLEVNKKNRIKIDYFFKKKNGHVLAKVVFGRLSQGPPNHAHGGAISAVLDETMGAAAWLNGFPVMTKQLSIEYISALPLNVKTKIETQIVKKEKKILTISGMIQSPKGQLYAKSNGLFKIIKINEMSEFGNFPIDKLKAIIDGLSK